MEQPTVCRGDSSGEQEKPNETATAQMAEIEELKTHYGKPRFACPLCGRIFEDDESAAMHSNDSECSKYLLKKKLDPSMVVVKDASTEKEENSTGLRATDQNESRKDGCEGIQRLTRTENDDRLLLAKYEKIFPSVNELTVLESYVKTVEQGLLTVSKELENQDEPKISIETTPGTPAAPQPMLDSIHRVGLFGESLHLRGDRDVQLVLLYNENSPPPTLELVDRVAQKLRAHLEVHEPWMKSTVESYPKKGLVILKACALVPNIIPGRDLGGEIVIQIWLSSTAFGSENVATNPSAGGIGNKGVRGMKESVPNIKDCLYSLNLVHRVKWFRSKKNHLKRKAFYFMVVLRIMSKFCRVTPVWSKIKFWMIEFIVAEAADTSSTPPSLQYLLIKTFAIIANRFFLTSEDDELSLAAAYPWRDYNIDANLSVDDRKIITSSAQNNFRLVAKGQLKKMLGFAFPDPFQSGESFKDADSEDVATTYKYAKNDENVILMKHKTMFPETIDLEDVEGYVRNVEESLLEVSKKLKGQIYTVDTSAEEAQGSSSIGTAPAAPRPMLKSIHHVGFFGEGLQLRGDQDVELVALCSPPPTLEFVIQVAELLKAGLEILTWIQFTVEEYPEQALVLVKATRPDCHLKAEVMIKIYLTSESYNAFRSEHSATTPRAGGMEYQGIREEGTPNIEDCLRALDLLNRLRWFHDLKTCWKSTHVIRVMRDFCGRTPVKVWSKIDFWVIEFIVAEAANFAPTELSLGELLRRTFERISKGFFLKSGDDWTLGISVDNPWNFYNMNPTANLTDDDMEIIKSSAQENLRLILSGDLYKILGFAYRFRDPDEIPTQF